MGRCSHGVGPVRRCRAAAVGRKPMTTADHLRLARRIHGSHDRHAVTIPRETLAWLIERAELGDDLIRAAVELRGER